MSGGEEEAREELNDLNPVSNVDNEEVNEDMDDLFGDDSEEDQEVQSKGTGVKSIVDDDEDEDQIPEEDQEEEEPKEIHAIDLDLAKHPNHSKSGDESYYLSLPTFLNIDALPFDAPAFKESIVEKQDLSVDDRMMEKLFAENVIRWRYNKVGEQVYKQSNAHFVEWLDGSLSLKLGEEIFDVVRNPTADHFLTVRHNDLEIFQTGAIFTKNMKLIPSSTSSEIHRRLTNYIKTKNAKTDHVSRAVMVEDPEEALKRREKEEGEAIRLQKKLEQKRLQEEERVGVDKRRARDPGFYSTFNDDDETAEVAAEEVDASGKPKGGYFDEEDDDDFVAEDDEDIVSDDEEDDLDRSERLNKLKESGMEKYQNNNQEEPLEEEQEEEEEEQNIRRKRRRVIADEDDEDED